MQQLTVDATIENISVVTDFVNAHLDALHCPLKTQNQIDVALDELFGNIARYAYPSGIGQVTVQVDNSESPYTVMITLIDNGIPYNPLEQKDPDIDLSAEEREIGGLGIFLSKKLMDSMSYEHKNGYNILLIRKKLQ